MTNYTNTPYFDKKRLTQSMGEWLQDHGFTHFVTLAFNRMETIDSARKNLNKFHAKLDRKILGKNYYKKPKDQRTFFVAFIEHMNSNFHYHLLLKTPNQYISRLEFHLDSSWQKVVNSGSSNVQAIYDHRGCTSYCLKEQSNLKHFNNFILSHEFLS